MFAENIKKRRKELGLTQSMMAMQLGVGQSTVSTWETGDCTPSLKRTQEIAALLGCCVSYQVQEDESRKGKSVVPVQPGGLTGGHSEEKREIIRRLREYRKTGGLGSLVKLAEAIRPKGRITDDLLREMCQDRVGEMPISQWRRIARALSLYGS